MFSVSVANAAQSDSHAFKNKSSFSLTASIWLCRLLQFHYDVPLSMYVFLLILFYFHWVSWLCDLDSLISFGEFSATFKIFICWLIFREIEINLVFPVFMNSTNEFLLWVFTVPFSFPVPEFLFLSFINMLFHFLYFSSLLGLLNCALFLSIQHTLLFRSLCVIIPASEMSVGQFVLYVAGSHRKVNLMSL